MVCNPYDVFRLVRVVKLVAPEPKIRNRTFPVIVLKSEVYDLTAGFPPRADGGSMPQTGVKSREVTAVVLGSNSPPRTPSTPPCWTAGRKFVPAGTDTPGIF